MRLLAGILAALLVASPATAQDDVLIFTSARVRVGGLGAIAAVDIRNDGPSDRLIGVRCLCEQPAQLHIAHPRYWSDILAHAELASLSIPGGKTTMLAYFASHHGGEGAIVPGEFILILNPSLLDKTRELELVLIFEHAGERTVRFPWTLARD